MFARLGPWCHDHRKLVLGLWIASLILGRAVSGGVGGGFRDEFNLPDVESKTGFDILDDEFGGQGTGVVGTIVFRAEQGVDDPEVASGDGGAVRRGRRRSTTSTAVAEPVRRGRRARRSRRRAPTPARSPTPTSSCPTTSTSPRAGEIRDEIRDDAPDDRRPARRARWLHLRRVRGAVVRAARPRVRHRHPHRRLRLGAGHGPARRRRPVRHRHRRGDRHVLLSNLLDDPRLRHRSSAS